MYFSRSKLAQTKPLPEYPEVAWAGVQATAVVVAAEAQTKASAAAPSEWRRWLRIATECADQASQAAPWQAEGAVQAAPDAGEMWTQTEVVFEEVEALPPGWKAAREAGGDVYYYHRDGRSQWDRPDGADAELEAEQEREKLLLRMAEKSQKIARGVRLHQRLVVSPKSTCALLPFGQGRKNASNSMY